MVVNAVELEVLNPVVRRREVMVLRRFIETFRVPEWHPCPCNEGKVAEELGKAYLERLLETSQRALLPVLVIGNYVLTSTCLLITAVKYASDEVLDRVRVEVWSLGEYRDEERFAVMALAAELCRVHEDRGDRDIRLEFARELIRRYVIDIAMRDPGQAMKVIDELARGFHTTELAKILSKYIRVTPRAGENYVRAFTRDESFINGLRDLVRELGNYVEKGSVLLGNEQNIGTNHGESAYGDFRRINEGSMVGREVRDFMEQFSAKPQDEAIVKRLRVAAIRNLVRGLNGANEVDLSPLLRLSTVDLNALYKRLRDAPPSERLDLLRSVVALIREERLSQVKLLLHAPGQPQPQVSAQVETGGAGTEGGLVFEREFKFACDEDTCGVIRELARASLKGDTSTMLKASLELAIKLASKLGLNEYATLLSILSRNANNALLINLLNTVVSLVREDQGLIPTLAEMVNAIKAGDPRLHVQRP